MSNPCSLYRCYGADDSLLYIGITGQGAGRFAGHSEEARWWPLLVRVEVEHFDTREEALEAERIAIRSGRPRFNKVHNWLRAVEPEVPAVPRDGFFCVRCGQFTRRPNRGLRICRRCADEISERSSALFPTDSDG